MAKKSAVYPRACGGTTGQSACADPANGLSPRLRGSRLILDRDAERDGSIPARAGEPIAQDGGRRLDAVYPRTCGGALASAMIAWLERGLSPRVRGSPFAVAPDFCWIGSIPARAGEPRWRSPA